MAVQRTLEMDFNTVLGKTHRMRVYDAKDPITPAEISTAMDNIISKNIFSGSGGELTGKLAARVVIKDSSDIALV